MTTYSQITDSEIDPGSPGTENLFTKIRDNPISMLEGDPTAPQPAPIVSMVILDRQEASSSAQLDFTAFNNSIYDTYYFSAQGIMPSTDGAGFALRTSADGVSYDSGTNYRYTNIGTSTTTGNTSIVVAGNVGNASLEGCDVGVTVFSAGLASATRIKADAIFRTSAGSTNYVSNGGERTSAGVVEGIRFFFDSGNIASGVITMYGLRNSYGGSFP